MKYNAFFAVSVVAASTTSAIAGCATTLDVGQAYVSGLPTEKLTSKLTFPLVRVAVSEKGNSSVLEPGITCTLTRSLDVSVSAMRGMKASAKWDVSFTGLSVAGHSIPPADLFSVNGEVKVDQDKIALIWHFGEDGLSSFFLLGAQHVSAHYRLWIPVGKYIVAEEGKKKGVAPYLGFGVALWRDKPYSLAVKYEVYSVKPQAFSLTFGVRRAF